MLSSKEVLVAVVLVVTGGELGDELDATSWELGLAAEVLACFIMVIDSLYFYNQQ